MHLVLGQALERYGTASRVSAWGWAGTQGLRALASWVYLCHLSPQQRRSGLGRGGGAEELDGVFQLQPGGHPLTSSQETPHLKARSST